MTTKQKYTSPYELDGRIPLRQAIPLGLQHVLPCSSETCPRC